MMFRKNVLKIGKLATVYIIGSIIPLLINIIVLPIYTRYLAPDQMGIISLCRQIITPLSILLNIGLLDAMTSMYYRTEEHLRPSLTKTIFLGISVQTFIIAGLLCVFAGWLSKVLLPNVPLDQHHIVLLWLMVVGICVAANYIGFGNRINQINEKPFRATFINLFDYFARVSLGLPAVVWLGWQGFGRQGTIVMAVSLAAVLGIFLSLKYQHGQFNFHLYKKALKLGVKFVPHSFSGVLAMASNMWLLAKLISAEALGVYGVAVFFAQLAQMPLAAFSYAAYPTLAKLMADGSDESRSHQSRIYTVLLCFLFWFVLCLSLSGTVGIKVLTAPAYHGAITVLPLLLLAWLIQFLYFVNSNPVYHFGGGLWMASATLSSLIVGIILNLIFTPMWGMYGAALSMIGCFLTRFLVISIVSRKMYKLPWEMMKITKCFIFAVAIACFDYFIVNRYSLWTQIPVKIALMLVYASGVFLFGIVRWDQVKSVYGELKSRYKFKKGS